MNSGTAVDRSLVGPALVAVAAALITIALKGGAFVLTDSVAILSDALESLVNLITSLIALVVLAIAARPADEEHAYGHTKVEYFASGFEGALILFAAFSIGYAAIRRFFGPMELAEVGMGLGITAAATAVNLVAARFLFRSGRRHRSIALESGAHHLMTDVWTSLGVIVGVAVSAWTGWLFLDPLIALLVAGNIVATGVGLIHRSTLGLIDTALPEETRREISTILETNRPEGVEYHAMRTRQAGRWRFISFHLLVPGDWTVQRGHDLLEDLEERIRSAVPDSTVFTHLEPVEDPLSWQDTELDRARD
ncbi:MAG: cation diffusion facilitator family transporter [Gemmatimonadota bacterium]